jgi:hypothetical protein
MVDEASMQAQYLENMDEKKENPSSYKEGKEKWKGKDKKTTSTSHRCKDLNNHYNHCNINGHTKYKCWKLHPDLNPKNGKKDAKKKNVLILDSCNHVKCS